MRFSARGFLVLSLLLFISPKIFASIPPTTQDSRIEKILAEKSTNKFEQLKKLGPGVYSDLRKLAFNQERVLGIRWQAFMAMVRLGERESMPEVNNALESNDWFLRDAALRVLPLLDRQKAYRAAVSKLGDSALVVRTSAVDTLAKVKNPACSEQLWSQLYSKENYIRHQSLWIRRHIVEALADLAPVGSEDKFIKILDDTDSSLFAPAIRGLERLTGKKLGSVDLPATYKRYFWKKWYSEKINKS